MKGKRLSIEEIYEKYPNQWMFLADTQINEGTELVSGIVIKAGITSEEAYEISAKYQGGGGVLYTGGFPEGVKFIF